MGACQSYRWCPTTDGSLLTRYANEVTPADLGGRVSLRHRTDDADGDGPSMTDVVGTLQDWTNGVLTVTRRDGTTAHVDETSIVGSRRLPPPREHRR